MSSDDEQMDVTPAAAGAEEDALDPQNEHNAGADSLQDDDEDNDEGNQEELDEDNAGGADGVVDEGP